MWGDAGSTYLDRIYVDVAAAAAEFHLGDTVSAELRLARAQAVAKQAGDGIARSLVAHATAALLGQLDDAGFERVEAGWRCVISGLADGIPPHVPHDGHLPELDEPHAIEQEPVGP